jgi:hypothetical protein
MRVDIEKVQKYLSEIKARHFEMEDLLKLKFV